MGFKSYCHLQHLEFGAPIFTTPSPNKRGPCGPHRVPAVQVSKSRVCLKADLNVRRQLTTCESNKNTQCHISDAADKSIQDDSITNHININRSAACFEW